MYERFYVPETISVCSRQAAVESLEGRNRGIWKRVCGSESRTTPDGKRGEAAEADMDMDSGMQNRDAGVRGTTIAC